MINILQRCPVIVHPRINNEVVRLCAAETENNTSAQTIPLLQRARSL